MFGEGQSITTIVERAIKEAAEKTGIGPTTDRRGNDIEQQLWSDFWDPDEGVRNLKLIACTDYTTTYEEDEIRRFTIDHWEFFYTKADGFTPKRHYVGVLWPQIQNYVTMWRDTRKSDYWAVGKRMAEELTAAKLDAPEWPRIKVPRALDEEVPF